MREIKFRVWDDLKERYMSMASLLKVEPAFFEPPFDFMALRFISNDLYKVEQYTGLLDCKGNEIYEGDIVSFQGLERKKSEVFFYGTSYYVYINKKYDLKTRIDEKQKYQDMGSSSGWDLDIEVIGNIHTSIENIEGE